MSEPGSEIRQTLEGIGRAHGFGPDATLCLYRALVAGRGMAQFSHPELGGLGQWAGGMIMVGEMGNPALRRRVGVLCAELAAEVERAGREAASSWWPAGLGTPASSGTQGDVAYAWFPQARRLAVRRGDRLAVHDTGAHGISGLAQDGGATPVLRLHADGREIALSDLPLADDVSGTAWTPPRAIDSPLAVAPDARPGATASATVGGNLDGSLGVPAPPAQRSGDPIATIARLAALRDSGALTDGEFAAKKTELLARV